MLQELLALDARLALFVNDVVRIDAKFDLLLHEISGNHILKGVPPVLCLWSLWFAQTEKAAQRRGDLIAVCVLAVFAICLGRFAALSLPYRARPLYEEGLGIKIPYHTPTDLLQGWSSFPSDHAVMYFAIATGVLLIHRGMGLALLAHAVFVISLPRVALGLHYPGDVLGGALLGAGAALLFLKPIARIVVPRLRLLKWRSASPQSFYPAMFFVSFEMASMFTGLRSAVARVLAVGL